MRCMTRQPAANGWAAMNAMRDDVSRFTNWLTPSRWQENALNLTLGRDR